MKKINILLAEDHEMVGEALTEWFNSQPELNLVRRVSSGQKVIDFLKEHSEPIDIVILDLFMEEKAGMDPDGLRTARHIFDEINYKKAKEVKVIIISVEVKGVYIAKAYKMGVEAFLPKKNNTEELLKAIHEVMEGGLYYDKEARTLIDKYQVNNKLEPVPLTETELKVLQLFAQGFSAKMIADKLGSKKGTVEIHSRNIRTKLKAQNAPQMISIAYKQGILKVE